MSKLLLLSVLVLGACGTKTPPKSTITTRTQSETSNDNGDKSSSDTKQTTIEQPDGSQTVKRTETTTTTVPSPGPSK